MVGEIHIWRTFTLHGASIAKIRGLVFVGLSPIALMIFYAFATDKQHAFKKVIQY